MFLGIRAVLKLTILIFIIVFELVFLAFRLFRFSATHPLVFDRFSIK